MTVAFGAILPLLMFARKAGILLSGQDAVRIALRRGERLLILLAVDCSRNVRRALCGYEERGVCTILELDAVRADIRVGGGPAAQILALPCGHGLAERILNLGELDAASDAEVRDRGKGTPQQARTGISIPARRRADEAVGTGTDLKDRGGLHEQDPGI